MKLHLGCGKTYLSGYVNVDYPPTEHAVEADIRADLYADIKTLSYPPSSIEEIRLHHVFEHFTRPVALALLCRWRDFLKPGGLLRIETPDAEANFRAFLSPFLGFAEKQPILRHLFGSHEAHWAVHCDAWYKKKFEVTLTALGFDRLKFTKTRYGRLRNIEVYAWKSAQNLGPEEYFAIVNNLLDMSTVRVCTNLPENLDSEPKLLKAWLDIWQDTYGLKERVKE